MKNYHDIIELKVTATNLAGGASGDLYEKGNQVVNLYNTSLELYKSDNKIYLNTILENIRTIDRLSREIGII